MKIIFLDIDGVLNCEESFHLHRGVIGIDRIMASLVKEICLATDAKIVLSTSWRGHDDGEDEIRRQVGEFLGRTPRLDSGVRGDEIKSYLSTRRDITKYAIIDDHSDMLPEQLGNFFQTSKKTGLTREIADRVIAFLLS